MDSSLCVAPINKYGIGRRIPDWRKVRVNNKWEMKRPATFSGTRKTINKKVSMPRQIRGGLGNRNMTRINFTAPAVRPRDPVDFDKINAINLAQFGQKVQLSDKTIDDLIRVNIGDPTDYAWIAEKKRLVALGSNDLPFGRKQRQIQKRINFGQASLNLEESLDVIRATIDAGRTENTTERQQLGIQIAATLTNMNDVRRMTEQQLRLIIQAVNRLKIPKHWRSAGFQHRLWTSEQFNAEKGPISMFLLANIKPDRTFNEPLLSRNKRTGAFTPVSLLQAYQMGSRRGEKRVLDLETATIVDEEFAKDMVKNSGVDDGFFNGVDITPRAPEEKKEAVDLTVFVNDELRRAYPDTVNWADATRGGTPSDIAELYTDKGLDVPENLRRALPAVIELGEFG